MRSFMANLINKSAPDFYACTVMPDDTIIEYFHLKDYIREKVGVVFFYPLDFSFVCPTEILAFNNKIDEFKKRDAAVIGISVDSQYSHIAYRNTPVENGGIGKIKFPLVSDITKQISRNYDVLANDSVAFRATFVIDKQGVIRHQLINDLPLGRNIDETIRMVDAVSYHDEHRGEVCPANWKDGQDTINPTMDGIKSYLQKHPK
jgi:peroxiredoxin 2/4